MADPATERPAPAAGRIRGLIGGVVILLVVLLPGLVAGARIGAPVGGLERDRIVAAIRAAADPQQPTTLAVRAFYGAALPADAANRLDGDPAALWARARLAAAMAIAVISALLYLLLALARGRPTALLACALFAFLPAVASEGEVLRPELPATLFGLLGTLLLACFAHLQATARAGRAPLVALLTMLAIGACYGLAAAVMGSAAIHFLIAGGVVTSVCVAQVLGWWRLLASGAVNKLRAGSRQLWPWLLLSLAVMATGLLVLQLVAGESTAEPASPSALGLVDREPLARASTVVLAAVGGLRLVFEVGLRLGRHHRLDAAGVVLIHAAVLLMQRSLAPPDLASLPAAVGLAMLLGEGVMTGLLVLAGYLVLRSRRARQRRGRTRRR